MRRSRSWKRGPACSTSSRSLRGGKNGRVGVLGGVRFGGGGRAAQALAAALVRDPSISQMSVTFPQTLFHERTSYPVIERLWGSRRKAGDYWVVAETSGIGSNSPLRSISRTRASWTAMSASISAIIAWNSGSSCSDSRVGAYWRRYHQKPRQPSSMACRSADNAFCYSPCSA